MKESVVCRIILAGCIITAIFSVINVVAFIVVLTVSSPIAWLLILFHIVSAMIVLLTIAVLVITCLSRPSVAKETIIAYVTSGLSIVFSLLSFFSTLIAGFDIKLFPVQGAGTLFAILTCVCLWVALYCLKKYYKKETKKETEQTSLAPKEVEDNSVIMV